MRFVLRALSFLLLVTAVFVAVIDAIQSVAGTALTLTSLESLWAQLGKASLASSETAIGTLPFSGVVLKGFHWLLAEPAFAVFLAMALLAWITGYRKAPAAGRFAA